MEWVKMRCDIFEHRKIKLLRKGPKGDTLVLLWVMLIAEAGKCGRGGALMISENKPYTAETLSLLLAIPESVVEQGLELFARLEMIERDAVIRIRNWRKYQSEDKLEVQREKDRITGRDGDRYTVVGKGGLVREVVLSRELVTALEARRLEEPRLVIDRGVHYSQHYDIGGGRTWSQSFSSASKRELGFSNGGHGLRHSYAQERMAELQQQGMRYDQAKATVAQEVGHFDKDTTEAYLR